MAPAHLAHHRAAPAPHVRIPRLAYRNPLPADQSSLASLSSSTSSTSTTTSTSAAPSIYADSLDDRMQQTPITTTTTTASTSTSTSTSISTTTTSTFTTTTSTATATTPSNASTARQSYDAPSFSSSSLASSNASTSSKDSKKSSTKKKKNNSVMGFLTLKEPSQSAFEQFAEQQRKLAAEKSGTASPSGSAGTLSYQKLPKTVPKVNSKWDGIPEALKAKDSASTASIKTKRNSGFSQATSRISSAPSASLFSLASDGSCNPPNSLASAASSVSNFPTWDERRDSGPSMTPSDKIHSPLPEMTYFFPDNPDPSGAFSSETTAQTSSSASIISTASTPVTTSSTSTEEAAMVASATSPSRGQANGGLDAEAAALFRRMNTHGYVAGEAQEVNLDEEDNDSDDSGTHDFLFDTPTMAIKDASLLASNGVSRSPMNFSRPLSSPQQPSSPDRSRSSPIMPMRTGVSRLPTLYEASIASTADSVDTVVDLPEVYEPSIAESDAASISPSVSSVTPSEMSASWYRSPRERLGLGGRIRKNDVLPWEKSEVLQPDVLVNLGGLAGQNYMTKIAISGT